MWKPSAARACLWFIFGAAASAAVAACWWHVERNNPRYLRTLLLKNPEFLADSPDVLAAVRTVLRNRQLDSEGEARERLLAERWARFTHVAFSPSLGNPAARSTLIEFTDYDCQPCKTSAAAVSEVLESHRDLRVAVMLLPTGGPVSEFAARVGYASYRQNPLQFARLHELLMNEKGSLSTAHVLAQAAASGLDIDQLQEEFGTSEVRGYLAQVRELAADLHVSGVPTFVIGKRLLSGGVSTAQLHDLIRSAQSPIVDAQPPRS
jgi:protein-disulfide isomerase